GGGDEEESVATDLGAAEVDDAIDDAGIVGAVPFDGEEIDVDQGGVGFAAEFEVFADRVGPLRVGEQLVDEESDGLDRVALKDGDAARAGADDRRTAGRVGELEQDG